MVFEDWGGAYLVDKIVHLTGEGTNYFSITVRFLYELVNNYKYIVNMRGR